MGKGKLFEQDDLGVCLIAGVYKTCFSSWALEYDPPRFFLTNNSAQPKECKVVQSDYIPMFVSVTEKMPFGRSVFYIDDGAIECGILIRRDGRKLVLLKESPKAHAVYIDENRCKWLQWIESDSLALLNDAVA